MLSLFPTLLAWNQLSPFLIRITLGAVFLYWAYKTFKKGGAPTAEVIFSYIDIAIGALLIIGLWTQAAALVAGIQLIVCISGKVRRGQFLTDGVNYYLLLLVMAISLLFTGAGFFARDLFL